MQLASSRAAIEDADEVATPSSTPALALARGKMTLAVRLAEGRAGEAARWVAEQAEVDAQLAAAMARATRAVEEARRWDRYADKQGGARSGTVR